jgi:hypothetical protein
MRPSQRATRAAQLVCWALSNKGPQGGASRANHETRTCIRKRTQKAEAYPQLAPHGGLHEYLGVVRQFIKMGHALIRKVPNQSMQPRRLLITFRYFIHGRKISLRCCPFLSSG